MQRAVPYAAGGWFCTDPATLLFTAALVENVPPRTYLGLFDNELFGQDFAKLDRIARTERNAASLLAATGGDLERSPRHRNFYRPNGWQDEIRAVFRSGTAVLGAACFTREEGAEPFNAPDLAFIERIAPLVGEGLRRGLVLEQMASSASDSPAMVVLRTDDSVQSITDEARALLEEMNIDAGTGLELPSVVYQAAHAARLQTPVIAAPTRVWLPSGRWLLVHASRLTDADRRGDGIAVMLQPAGRSQPAALIVELDGLTRKECRVTELLVRGLGIEEIAQTLSISRNTVRDHVKVIFAKMGVASRPELTAKLVHERIQLD